MRNMFQTKEKARVGTQLYPIFNMASCTVNLEKYYFNAQESFFPVPDNVNATLLKWLKYKIKFRKQ